MQLTSPEIKAIQKYFTKKPVLKAYLFGSFARNEADEKSDIDLLVELDYSKHIGLDFIGMKLELENQLHKTIDLVSSNAVSENILPFILKDKQLIYERKHG